MIYFIIFFIILFLALKYDFRPQTDTSRYVKIIFAILVILAGLRYRVGTDTLVYMDEYEAGVNNLAFIRDKYLIGWYLLMKLFHHFHCSFYIVQIVVALIINFGIFRFIKTSVPKAVFSGLLTYYAILYLGWNFEVLRQAICVSLFLLALPFLEDGKYVKYYTIICVACTIHETSLFLIFIPLILKIRVTYKTLKLFLIVITVFIIAAPLVREQVVYYSLLLMPFQDKASHYFENIQLGDSFNIGNYFFNIILNVVVPLYIIKRNIKQEYFSNSFVILSLLSLITYALSMMLPMMYRLNYFFSLFPLLLIIFLFREITSNSRFYFCMLLLFIALKGRVYFVEKNNIPAYVHYHPYKCIVNEEKVLEREYIDNL